MNQRFHELAIQNAIFETGWWICHVDCH